MKPAAPGSSQLENVLPEPCTTPCFVGGELWSRVNTRWLMKSLFPALTLYVFISPLIPSDAPLVSGNVKLRAD